MILKTLQIFLISIFCAQFSEESSYEIDIDFSNDPFLDFTFNETSIFNLLKQTNPNKSQGANNIGGYLLKTALTLYPPRS